jgi:hypothetical protein
MVQRGCHDLASCSTGGLPTINSGYALSSPIAVELLLVPLALAIALMELARYVAVRDTPRTPAIR